MPLRAVSYKQAKSHSETLTAFNLWREQSTLSPASKEKVLNDWIAGKFSLVILFPDKPEEKEIA